MKDVPPDKYPSVTDPGIRAFLAEGERLYPADAVSFTMAEQRAFYDRYCAHFRKPRPAGIAVEDFSVGHVPCRRYHPAISEGAPVLYLHGGGYVMGGLDSHDDICAELAAGAGTGVVAIHYRLAPENPFPAALDDAWAVMGQLLAEGRGVVLAGDSAGGNLSAALAIRARDEGVDPIKGQVLIYPGLGGDHTAGSYITQADAPGLSTADVLYYRDVYKGAPHKLAEPLRETDFSGLAPAFLVAAGIDPLHDDCLAYAERLKAAGVAAEVRDEPLLVHAFLRARHMSRPAAKSFAAIVRALRDFARR